MINLFIAGIGNIGKRHLQAAYNVVEISKFHCYDFSKKTLDVFDEFIEKNNFDFESINKYYDLDDFTEEIDNNSIIIVATTANGRFELISNLIKKRPRFIVVEKPVCQTKEDYIKIENLSKQYNVKIFVNYIAHAQHIYQNLKKDIIESKSFLMTTKMPKWGISTVGIHQIELYMWLSGDKNFKYTFSNRFKVYQQKRESFFDFVGAVVLEGEKGSAAYISNIISDEGPSSIQFSLDNKTITVYESLGKYVIADKNIIKIKDLKIRFVSQYMTEVLNHLINTENCYLPDLANSKESHNVLFEFMESKKCKELNIT